MKRPVQIGDPATLLLYLVPPRVAQGKIVQVTDTAVRIDISEGVATRLFTREGQSWVRGHHATDSPDVRALLVTAAMERP